MSLSDLKIPEVTIETPGGDFTVRGLSSDDAVALVAKFGPALGDIYTRIVSAGASITLEDPEASRALVAEVVRDGPLLVAHIIAIAAGEPESVHVSQKLPITVQVDALRTIIQLTFVSEAQAKKLLGTILDVARRLMVPLPQI